MGVGCLGRCMIQARVKTRNRTTLRVKLSEPAGLYLIIILFHQWQQLCQLMQTFVTGEVEGRKGGHMGNIFTISSIYFLRFFWMWPIFKVFIEFVTIFLFFFLMFWVWFFWGGGWARGMWDLGFPTRDRTCTPCIGRWCLHHWTSREVPAGFCCKPKTIL